MKKIIFYSIILLSLSIKAQSSKYEWAAGIGGTGSEYGVSIAVDDSGNVYTTGNFEGTVDFDPGVGVSNLTSNGNSDVFIQKMDALGNFLWVKTFGGSSFELVTSLALDSFGNVYSTGFFAGIIDFDPGAGTSNLNALSGIDAFVQKLDSSGNFIWAKSFGGSSNTAGRSIVVDASGNVLTAGVFEGIADFDPDTGITNLTSNGDDDIFVQKMDASGNFLWAKGFGGVFIDYGLSLAVDVSNNVYTTGWFSGTVDFDPGVGTNNFIATGDADVFVQKMDSTGNFLWAKTFGGTSDDIGNSIAVDLSGNVYTIGSFEGIVDFDPGAGTRNLTSNGNDDIFVQKMDASGNFIWANSVGGTFAESGICITADLQGNIYTTGSFHGTVDFDPGIGTSNLTSSGGADIFLQKLDATGNLVWVKAFGGASNDSGISVAVDASDNVHATGSFEGTADFDPSVGIRNLTSAGGNDIFVSKYNQLVLSTLTYIKGRSQTVVYPNPSQAFYNIKLRTEVVEIQILSPTGQLITSFNVQGSGEIQIGSKLRRGIYMMRIHYANGNSEVKRLVKTE